MNEKAIDAFKTISEVSEELNIPQHVLRFWEKKFKYIKPMTRGGGRRLYRPEDVELLKAIHNLLYTEMYTISGVQKIFKDKGKGFILESASSVSMKKLWVRMIRAKLKFMIIQLIYLMITILICQDQNSKPL